MNGKVSLSRYGSIGAYNKFKIFRLHIYKLKFNHNKMSHEFL